MTSLKQPRESFLPGMKKPLFVLIALLIFYGEAGAAAEEQVFRIAIMQPQKGSAQIFRPLEDYLEVRGVSIKFIGAANYLAAANMFADGTVDGMFSGSAVAGCLFIKKLAYPVLRPVDANGQSTYRAVIIAPRGAPPYTGEAGYFRGKRVIACALASAGDFFFRSIPGIDSVEATLLTVPSHGAALAGISKGAAELAIVKNLVWDSLQAHHPDLQQVGNDPGVNPNGTLIVSRKADPKMVDRLTAVLLALGSDSSPQATAVRKKMGIQRYIVTSLEDFEHTFGLLNSAGVTESFSFE